MFVENRPDFRRQSVKTFYTAIRAAALRTCETAGDLSENGTICGMIPVGFSDLIDPTVARSYRSNARDRIAVSAVPAICCDAAWASVRPDSFAADFRPRRVSSTAA
jgi:hypothetical protein